MGPIAAVTVRAADLDSTVAAWRAVFGWEERDAGRVTQERARAWGAPAAAGRPWRELGPPSGADAGVRFVAGPEAPGHRPLRSLGWAALELLVADADATAARLEGTAFRMLAPPRALGGDPALGIRALQAVGPAGEVCYLTEVGPAADPALPRARCAVDRPFVAVLAARDAGRSAAVHAEVLGLPPPDVASWRIDVLNAAFDLDPGTRHPLATLPLAGGCLLEVDGYPPAAVPARADGHLPPGVAAVTLATAGTPCVYRGPDGEVVELVSRRSSATSS